MRFRSISAVVFAGLLLVAATAWMTAQAVAVNPVPPKVMSGADIGFRVEGVRGQTPVGTLVVRINGEWIEADFAARVLPDNRRP